MRSRLGSALPVVAALHVVGWGLLLAGHDVTGFGIGLGATAYALGLRHAFDADHIAAIDNTTRQLLAEGRPARTVGLWFSLGHSTVVTLLCALLAFGVRAVGADVADEGSALHRWTGTVGPAVSGLFLLAIAAMNLVGLRRRRAGGHHHPSGGPVSALLRRAGSVIDRPTRMYVVGLLFGLGFDTATEIGLLALAAAASLGSLPWWSALTPALLFAAGMSLLDSAQGAMSRRTYSWRSFHGDRPARRYDAVVTGVSVVAALAVAVVELVGVVADAWPVPPWLTRLGGADLDTLGLALTGALVTAWGIAALTVRRVER